MTEKSADENNKLTEGSGPIPQNPLLQDEKAADSSANPYGEESLRDIIRDLMDEFKNLHAKSILTEKEATIFANLAAFGDYHKTPSLIKWCNEQMKHRMSIGGQRIKDVSGVFGGAVEQQRKKSIKDRIVEIS